MEVDALLIDVIPALRGRCPLQQRLGSEQVEIAQDTEGRVVLPFRCGEALVTDARRLGVRAGVQLRSRADRSVAAPSDSGEGLRSRLVDVTSSASGRYTIDS